ncbi:hypothetical protein HanRHA438_Chr01g0008961 [Helianthus annuus]|nr:hypothetical protein HanRHA438_Chr01g0008961 [Helianthus annuus]
MLSSRCCIVGTIAIFSPKVYLHQTKMPMLMAEEEEENERKANDACVTSPPLRHDRRAANMQSTAQMSRNERLNQGKVDEECEVLQRGSDNGKVVVELSPNPEYDVSMHPAASSRM